MNKIFLILTTVALISSTAIAKEVSFSAHTVTVNLAEASAVDVGDLNGDGFQDMVTTALAGKGELSWWENDSAQNYTKHVLMSDFDGARSVKVVDIDKNNTNDIIAAAVRANKIILWKNDGKGNFTEHVVDKIFLGAHTVDVKDVNNDGHLDILCSGTSSDQSQREAAWWENDGNENFTKHTVSSQFVKSCFIEGAFINDDQFMDILVCDEVQGDVIWFENDGNHQFKKQHVVDNNFPYIHTTVARDIDKDGDLDILGTVTMQSKLAWWENEGNGSFSSRKHIAILNGAIWVDTLDIDKDGDYDLVTASMGENYLNWWENDGSCKFTKHNFPGYVYGGFGFAIKDMDGDSDNDIAAVGYSSNRLIWLENTAVLAIKKDTPLKTGFQLKQNYPNPFNPKTVIAYRLPKADDVELTIYNSMGQKIKTLVETRQTAGEYQANWDGRNESGNLVASGIYFFRMETDNFTQSKRMFFLK